ncbi:MAG: queuosine biosynthesis protein QueC [Hyphomonadaceae bacterium]|nr:MAG: queuosine biosynthesis protein QueC [Hyphomonadaceae bacterium]KAF0183431.1 MAG: queuosine biosynthesis protein QueC [Hyphomonadaceae bacterium]
MNNHNFALVLFSGGQDSTACLAYALANFDKVETIGFDYGQRHSIELEQRLIVLEHIRTALPSWATKLGEDHVLDLKILRDISDCALTSKAEIAFDKNGLPNTFVPARNLLFLNFAAAVGYRRAIHNLIGGMCETDFSGYPDCRRKTLDATEHSLSLGMAQDFKIITPLMYIDKAATWALASDIGGEKLTQIIIEHTHTCYIGDREHRHVWGYGCGECPACKLRKSGYENWVAA